MDVNGLVVRFVSPTHAIQTRLHLLRTPGSLKHIGDEPYLRETYISPIRATHPRNLSRIEQYRNHKTVLDRTMGVTGWRVSRVCENSRVCALPNSNFHDYNRMFAILTFEKNSSRAHNYMVFP